jgi:flagellar basal-body rod protein FlgB
VISNIDGGTTALLSLALDAAVLRQQAAAHNLANANTPGFRPVRVRFEEHLARLAGEPGQVAPLNPAELAGLGPTLETAPAGTPAPAADAELASLSETVVHHQALLKALNRHFSLLAVAVSDGRR